MTEPTPGVDAAAARARRRRRAARRRGFYDLVEARVRRLFVDNPVLATVPRHPHRGPPARRRQPRRRPRTRSPTDRAHLAAVEALDPAGLSPEARFERDLEVHNLRLALFEADEVRRWERRSTAAGELGDAVFLLFARGAAPLAERLERITDRLEAAPAFLEQAHGPGRVGPQVALVAGASRRATRRTCPALFARGARGGRGRRSTPGASPGCDRAIADGERRARGLRRLAARDARRRRPTTGRWAASRYDELVRLRVVRATSTPTRSSRSARSSCSRTSRRGARRPASSTPTRTCRRVIDRLKSRPPGDVRARRSTATATSMRRARAHLIEHGIVDDPRRRDRRGHRRPRSTCAR